MLGLITGYLFGFIGSMPLTGPIAVIVFHQTILGQYRKALLIGIGAALAEGIYCGLAMFGFDILVKQYPVTISYVRAIAGVLLLALGIVFLRSSKINFEQKDSLPPEKGFKRHLFFGFSLAMMNPLLLLSWATAIAMFYSLTNLRFSQLSSILFPIAVTLGIISWFFFLVYLLKRHREKLGIQLATILVKITSLLLLLLGIFVLAQQFW